MKSRETFLNSISILSLRQLYLLINFKCRRSYATRISRIGREKTSKLWKSRYVAAKRITNLFNSFNFTVGLRSDGTLDPHHAAILFRDSRGVSFFHSPSDGVRSLSFENIRYKKLIEKVIKK